MHKGVQGQKIHLGCCHRAGKKAFPHFIRQTYEINNEALIAFRDDQDFKSVKEACYVDVIQDESFYVEANKEDLSVAYSIHR